MIKKKFYCHNSLLLLIILWVFGFSVWRAYIAPMFDHEAHCYVYSSYFYEANGWFFILLVQCLKRCFGASLFAVRFLPILANLGICFLIYRIADYIYNKKIALLSVFLYAINPMAYFFASYVRFYAFGVFFILLACYLTFKAYESDSAFIWTLAAIAYAFAFNSWVLTIVVMIGIWLFMIFIMEIDRKSRNRILQISMLISLNFILLIIFDVRGIDRISNASDFAVFQIMSDVFSMSGLSCYDEPIVNFICRLFSLQRDYVYYVIFALFLFYSFLIFACTFKDGWERKKWPQFYFINKLYSCFSFVFTYKVNRIKYSSFPSFVFLISILIFILFSIFKTSVFNAKNLFLLLPLWIVMFSVIAVKLRIIVLFLIALLGWRAIYISCEGYVPEHQMRTFVNGSYEMYLSNNNIVGIMENLNMKIGDNVHYEPDAIESILVLQSALNSEKVCLLLTDIRKEKLYYLVNRHNPGLRVYIYGEVICANIRAYLIVPSSD
ncbi:MAG: glycosyltransferase family 39 protein [bacterium]|nr:glycosyltransferase family 39 protein [bacterium]